MGVLNFLLNSMSEGKLCKIESKVRNKLDSIDYESKKYLKIDLLRINVVNAIARKVSGKLPKREHGWYLDKDN